MYQLFLLLIFILPFLLLATYLMTAKAKSFKRIFLAHTITFLVYMAFVINYSRLLTGHDEYGLGQIGLGIAFISAHIIIGFVHGVYITYKNKQAS